MCTAVTKQTPPIAASDLPVSLGTTLEQTYDGVDHGLAVHAFCR